MVSKVVETLTSLQHKHLKFTDSNLEFIETMVKGPQNDHQKQLLYNCRAHFHPNQSCLQYKGVKLRIALKNSIILHFFATLLPALIKNRRQLKTDFKKTIIKLLKHFISSVTWLTLLASIPACSMCHVIRLVGQVNQTSAIICFIIAQVSWCFENISKHPSYAGYLTPKAIEIMYSAMV